MSIDWNLAPPARISSNMEAMSKPTNVLHPTPATFENEVMKASKPVLVDFWAPWCPPCRALKPVVEQLAGEMQQDALFAFINVDEHPALAEQFGVQSIPALMIVSGGDVVDAWTGFAPKAAIKGRLDAVAK
jgi:thioredoxin 1